MAAPSPGTQVRAYLHSRSPNSISPSGLISAKDAWRRQVSDCGAMTVGNLHTEKLMQAVAALEDALRSAWRVNLPCSRDVPSYLRPPPIAAAVVNARVLA